MNIIEGLCLIVGNLIFAYVFVFDGQLPSFKRKTSEVKLRATVVAATVDHFNNKTYGTGPYSREV